jgi:hypothetical protein
MWQCISNIASVLTIASAIITLSSAFAMKKYYEKIVRQYSIEKLTTAEQQVQTAKTQYQQIKRIYSGDSKGVKKESISMLYIDIDDKFDKVLFSIPTSFESINTSIKEARKEINSALKDDKFMATNEHFSELGILLDNIYLGIKVEKEKGQRANATQ